ncbi:MAG: CPBP family intramembrane metalloprotease [Actinobacteria bacterium]|nr:CPBP family intramembrane metalloprotease [Actinomycetota bacterium]MCB8996909.1 CPBP family intramembrane metalloprotease [Actinomycetota bacterium]
MAPSNRSATARFFGYPLVTILIAFIIFGPVLGILFALISQMVIRLFGAAPLPPVGYPTDPGTLLAWGFGKVLAAGVLSYFAIIVYRGLIARGCEGRSNTPELALTPTARRWLWLGTALSLAVVALTLAGIAIGGSVSVAASASLLGGLMAAVGLSVFSGVVEELLARGSLFRISEQHVGSLLALVITAGIFGLQHIDNPGATLASTLSVAIGGGLMLSGVYMLTRTLWATIAVHAAWNFGQSVLGIPVSGNIQTGVVQVRLDGPDWLTGGPFGIEPSVIALLLWTGVFAVVLVLAVRAERWQSWRAARGAVAEGRGAEPVGIQS